MIGSGPATLWSATAVLSLVLSLIVVTGAERVCAQEVYLWAEAEEFSEVDPEKMEPRMRHVSAVPDALVSEQYPSNGDAAAIWIGSIRRELFVPVAGRYEVWVRYRQERGARAPFSLRIEQGGKELLSATLGAEPGADRWDELLLRYGWTFVWANAAVELESGRAIVTLSLPDRGQRTFDCVLLTTDTEYRPVANEPPPFDYLWYCDDWRARRVALQPLVRPDFAAVIGFPPAADGDVYLSPTMLDLGERTSFSRGELRQRASLSSFLLDDKVGGAVHARSVPGWLRRAMILLEMSHAGFLKQGPAAKPGAGSADVFAETMAFLREHPDHGVPFTPMAVLMCGAALTERRRGEGWPDSPGGRMMAATMNVLRYPASRVAAEEPGSGRRSFVPAPLGDLFDMLVALPDHKGDLSGYRVILVVGDEPLDGEWIAKLLSFVQGGGTLVLNGAQVGDRLGPELLGAVRIGQVLTSSVARCELDDSTFTTVPFEYEQAAPVDARVLMKSLAGDPLVTSKPLGKGQIVFVLVPHGVGLDGQCSVVWAHLIHHLASGLMPLEVTRGEVEWLVNRTPRGWLVTLIRPTGDEAEEEIEILSHVPVTRSSEWISGRQLTWERRDDGTARLTLSLSAGGIGIVEMIEWQRKTRNSKSK